MHVGFLELNPEIIFAHIFCILNLDFFQGLIPQKCVGSMHVVLVTHLTVLCRSFRNFTGALTMVRGYACGIFRILKLFFCYFSHFNRLLKSIIPQKCIGSIHLVAVTPPTVLD